MLDLYIEQYSTVCLFWSSFILLLIVIMLLMWIVPIIIISSVERKSPSVLRNRHFSIFTRCRRRQMKETNPKTVEEIYLLTRFYHLQFSTKGISLLFQDIDNSCNGFEQRKSVFELILHYPHEKYGHSICFWRDMVQWQPMAVV